MLWLCLSVAVILLLALVSYYPTDPSFTFAGPASYYHNWMGPLGAWLADWFFLIWGWSALLLPILIVGLGFLVHKPPILRSRMELWMRSAGGLVTVLALSGFLANLFAGLFPSLPAGTGGVMGFEIATLLRALLDPLGTGMLLLALILAGVSLATSWSWLRFLTWTGSSLLRLTRSTWDLLARSRASTSVMPVRSVHRSLEEEVDLIPRTPVRIEPSVERLESGARLDSERQQTLFETGSGVGLPPLGLLDAAPESVGRYSDSSLDAMSRIVELKLKDFSIAAQVVMVTPGPVVTRFELQPAPGIKVSQITSLVKDLARALSVVSVRVVENIPGKSVVGLEVPNERRELVTLGEILRSRVYESMNSPLTLALGKDISGQPVIMDLERMPHLLIAGTTGSGKSVALNAMILSLLYKSTPDRTRLILVDPKMLELSVYQDIPHLLTPVVTDARETAAVLRWAIAEMERRYQLLAQYGARSLAGYNRKVEEAAAKGQILMPSQHPDRTPDESLAQEPPQTLPYIVMVVDELADLMLVLGKKVDELFARLAQKARASGIHLILATQRPSADVITGLIKANIPARIAFQIASKTDSRIILDQNGAEALLGNGDMLFLPPGQTVPQRVHGAFVSDNEVHRIVRHLRKAGTPQYLEAILEQGDEDPLLGSVIGGAPDEERDRDDLYDGAVQLVLETKRASVSMVQRRFRIGYNRAARLVERMEREGLVGPLQSNGFRQVLVQSSHHE
ncbi:cell division protein FtsK [mine drainage metagenome]|uniref:Cell division protein FtsK n=2 Tax=mine drainage metagenome TaxID=410659 RepID=T1B0V7_9ZZZZ